MYWPTRIYKIYDVTLGWKHLETPRLDSSLVPADSRSPHLQTSAHQYWMHIKVVCSSICMNVHQYGVCLVITSHTKAISNYHPGECPSQKDTVQATLHGKSQLILTLSVFQGPTKSWSWHHMCTIDKVSLRSCGAPMQAPFFAGTPHFLGLHSTYMAAIGPSSQYHLPQDAALRSR